MTEPTTLLEAIQYFSDAENCRKFMISIRWSDGIIRCPRCGHDKVAFMEKSNLYFCPKKHEKAKFSLKVGTIFEESPIQLNKWLPAAWLIANCKNGISSYELARALGVTQKTAWFISHRLREAMRDERTHKFGGGGPVESDEAFIGPNPRKMNRTQRKKYAIDRNKGEMIAKTAIHGMLDRELRQVRANVIPNIKRETLQNAIIANVEKKSKIYTDNAPVYHNLKWCGQSFVHETVDHIDEYVRGQVHTNGIENFWSLLKRTLRGTYVAVEPFHLDAYLDEQVYRFNNRATKDNPLSDADRFALLMTQVVNRRLTYAELTGKAGGSEF